MKAIRIPVFVLAVLLAFSVCNAVHLTRRCALWQAELAEADRAAAMGALHHLLAQRGVVTHVDLGKGNVLPLQQGLRPVAVAAERRRVDCNLRHDLNGPSPINM